MAKTKSDMSAWASETDLEATRALIEELQAEGKPWDKLESNPGKYVTNYRRICPKRPEWSHPYQIVPVHYLGPNNRMVGCLKEMHLGECPACNLRWQLHEGGDDQAASGLRPSIRTFLNTVHIDQGGEMMEDKVYLLGLNKLQFMGKQGVKYDMDEEGDLPLYYFFEKYGDLSHVETGRNLKIKAKQEKSGDFDVLVMRFSVADPSPFQGTGELLEEGLVNLQEVVAVVEPDEMMALIQGRATGAMVLDAPGDTPVAQLEAPKAGRFANDDEDEEAEAAVVRQADSEGDNEPAEDDARAPGKPPKTNPDAALERLRQGQKES